MNQYGLTRVTDTKEDKRANSIYQGCAAIRGRWSSASPDWVAHPPPYKAPDKSHLETCWSLSGSRWLSEASERYFQFYEKPEVPLKIFLEAFRISERPCAVPLALRRSQEGLLFERPSGSLGSSTLGSYWSDHSCRWTRNDVTSGNSISSGPQSIEMFCASPYPGYTCNPMIFISWHSGKALKW